MDLATFGQSIKQKYPQYSDMGDEELGQKMIEKYPQYKDMVNQGTTTAVERIGLYNIPVIGGLLRGVVEPNTQLFDTTMQKRQQLANTAQSNPQQASQMLKQDLGSGNTLQDLFTGQGMARTALPAALTDSSIVDLPGLLKGGVDLTKNIGTSAINASKLLTQKGAIAAQKAGASRGADVLISDIEKTANQIAGDKQPKEVMDEVNRVMSRLRGANIEIGQEGAKPALTTQDILDWRKQLDSELPKTFWEQLSAGGNQAKNKAVGIVRTALTNHLHESAPGTAGPDRILGTYANIGGDIPKIIAKLLGTVAVDRTAKAIGGPQAEAGADIFTVLKMLGKI